MPSTTIVPAETLLEGPSRPDFLIVLGLDVQDQVPGQLLLLKTPVGSVWRLAR